MQNPNETEDLRVRRTRKMLQDALVELTVEKGLTNITVRDLTERAMVNRSTFYRHYLDKRDLVSQFTQAVNDLTFDEDDIVADKVGHKDERPSGLFRLLQHIEAYADFYRVMLGPNGDPGFIEDLRQNAEDRFRYLLTHPLIKSDSDADTPPLDLRLKYISSAGIGGITWWVQNDLPCSAEQLAKWIGRLASSTLGLAPNVPENL